MARAKAALLLAAALAGCTVIPPSGDYPHDPARGRPLDTLPGGARLSDIENDLLATARQRFGEAAVERALATPTHLFVKRFAGMVPPPPPGAGADWRPPTPSALLLKDNAGWQVATESGWRPADAGVAAELDAILAQEAFWRESEFVQACPDYGAANLLLKVPRDARIVRSHQCDSASARAVQAALRA